MINNTMRSALPSIEGGVGGGSPFSWGKLLKILIAVLTAIAGSIGLASCAAKRETHPSPPCEGGSTVIAEKHYTMSL